MSMTITDANDVNTLLHWIRGDKTAYPGGPPVSAENVIHAGRRLAHRARKTLLAGLPPDQVAVRVRPVPGLEETLRSLLGKTDLLLPEQLDGLEQLAVVLRQILAEAGRMEDSGARP